MYDCSTVCTVLPLPTIFKLHFLHVRGTDCWQNLGLGSTISSQSKVRAARLPNKAFSSLHGELQFFKIFPKIIEIIDDKVFA